MRDIKFSLMWTDGKTWMDLRHTLVEMENGEHWEAMADMPMLSKFVLKHKRQFTGLQDSKGVDIYEGDRVIHTMPNTPLDKCFQEGRLKYEGVIEYVDCLMSFRTVNYDGIEEPIHPDIELEVIGNIHEANNNGAR